MSRCETCLDSRCIVSENGFHYICCLKEDSAINCLTGKEDHYIENPMKVHKEE